MLTSDQRFLQPYVRARRDLPAQSRLLMTLAPGAVSTELDREWRAYVRDWAAPLIALAARSPARARSKIQSGQGAQRVDRMQALIDPFDARMDAIAERDRARVAHAVDSGVSIGILGAAIRALVFAAIIALSPALRSRADPPDRGRDAASRGRRPRRDGAGARPG